MKKCNSCGALLADQVKFCSMCGSTDLTFQIQGEQPHPVNNMAYQNQNVQTPDQPPVQDKKDKGNVFAGFIGAFLFSILGGVLYFVFYQLGVIAAICGLAIFFLAIFGYNKFSKTQQTNPKAGIVAAVLSTIVMIYLAEYFSISFEFFMAYKDQGVTFMEVITAMPEILAEPEVSALVEEDLAFAYIVSFIAIVLNIVKTRKKSK